MTPKNPAANTHNTYAPIFADKHASAPGNFAPELQCKPCRNCPTEIASPNSGHFAATARNPTHKKTLHKGNHRLNT